MIGFNIDNQLERILKQEKPSEEQKEEQVEEVEEPPTPPEEINKLTFFDESAPDFTNYRNI